MHSEIKSVKDEKSYWQERLDRMSRQIKTMGKYKTDTCKPMTKNKFHLINKKNNMGKSILLESGALYINQAFNDLQKTRTLKKEGQEIFMETGRKDKFMESERNQQSLSPLGQGIINDNLHPFSEIKGKIISI